MIAVGWMIPAVVALTVFVARHALEQAGKFAGGFLLMALLVPVLLTSLILLAGGTFSASRALYRKAVFSRTDWLFLLVGVAGLFAGLYLVSRAILASVI